MNKAIKHILEESINREYMYAFGRCEKQINGTEDLLKEHQGNWDVQDENLKELLKLLPKDKHKLLYDYESAIIAEASMETRLMFREGIRLGLTELNFLKAAVPEIDLYFTFNTSENNKN